MSNQIERVTEALIKERTKQPAEEGHVLNGRQFIAAILATDHGKKEIEEILKEHFGE